MSETTQVAVDCHIPIRTCPPSPASSPSVCSSRTSFSTFRSLQRAFFFEINNRYAGVHAPRRSPQIYPALCSGTSIVQVNHCVTCILCAHPAPSTDSFLPATPDSHQLGHAKVVLDNSIASGSITKDGQFVMCAKNILPTPWLTHAVSLTCPTLHWQPRCRSWDVHRLCDIP